MLGRYPTVIYALEMLNETCGFNSLKKIFKLLAIQITVTKNLG